MVMKARIKEFQAELRNQSATLQKVMDGNIKTDFFLRTKNRILAKRYQRSLYKEFDQASSILLPPKD